MEMVKRIIIETEQGFKEFSKGVFLTLEHEDEDTADISHFFLRSNSDNDNECLESIIFGH